MCSAKFSLISVHERLQSLGVHVQNLERQLFVEISNPTGICTTRGGEFEPHLGEVANLNQPNILVLVLIMVEFQGKESAFGSKWLRRNFQIVE